MAKYSEEGLYVNNYKDLADYYKSSVDQEYDNRYFAEGGEEELSEKSIDELILQDDSRKVSIGYKEKQGGLMFSILREIAFKPWGEEEIWANTPYYIGKILKIRKDCKLSKQYHIHKIETLRVLSGKIRVEIYDKLDNLTEEIVMNPGDTHHISNGTIHRTIALEDSQVLEVSTPHYDDIVRIEDDYGRVK